MKLFLLLILLLTHTALAQVIETTPPYPTEGSVVVPDVIKPEDSVIEEVVKEAGPLSQERTPVKPEAPAEKSLSSQENRERSLGTVMVGYQLITSWVPSKKTLSYGHIFNQKWTVEGEFSFATINAPYIGVDLGRIKERRYTFQARRYVGNSFHLTFGAVYSTFSARLGSDILDSFGNEINSEFSAGNIGATGGIGNRWQWQNGFTLGIDWIRLNIPLYETQVEDKVLESVGGSSDREDIKDVIRTFNRIPTFVLFGINLGYSF